MEQDMSAPRITIDDVETAIASEHYFTAGDGVAGAAGSRRVTYPASLGLLTFCVLVLRNGFTVTGESACAHPDNFDAAIGRSVARENAVAKVWPLLGYALKSEIAGLA